MKNLAELNSKWGRILVLFCSIIALIISVDFSIWEIDYNNTQKEIIKRDSLDLYATTRGKCAPENLTMTPDVDEKYTQGDCENLDELKKVFSEFNDSYDYTVAIRVLNIYGEGKYAFEYSKNALSNSSWIKIIGVYLMSLFLGIGIIFVGKKIFIYTISSKIFFRK